MSPEIYTSRAPRRFKSLKAALLIPLGQGNSRPAGVEDDGTSRKGALRNFGDPDDSVREGSGRGGNAVKETSWPGCGASAQPGAKAGCWDDHTVPGTCQDDPDLPYDSADQLLEVTSTFNPNEPESPGPLYVMAGATDVTPGWSGNHHAPSPTPSPVVRERASGQSFARDSGAPVVSRKPLFRTAYSWDSNGNQIAKVGPGNRTAAYSFNSLDRMVGVDAPGSPVQAFTPLWV